MGEQTNISWCDHTFNPWWGCVRVSPACDDCYAARDAARYYPKEKLWDTNTRRYFGAAHWQTPYNWARNAAQAGVRRRVFCASMADVFDNQASENERERLWRVIRETPELDWLLLTKRISNAIAMFPEDWGEGYPNVWVGISVVNQTEANRDIPRLARTPARLRFLSVEPMLRGISVTRIKTALGQEPCNRTCDHFCEWCGGSGVRNRPGFDWVICGGESGPRARPIHVEWARALRDQVTYVGRPFFFKQWGEWIPECHLEPDTDTSGVQVVQFHADRWQHLEDLPAHRVRDTTPHVRLGKRRNGDWLDGRQHHEFPRSAA